MNTDRNEGMEKENPEPFFIWKNARKQIKKQERKRKQSEQYPATTKKTRKMTISQSHAKSFSEEPLSLRSPSSEMDLEEQMPTVQPSRNIPEEELLHVSEGEEAPEHKESDEQHEIEMKIPFNCNEWELDKESPFMKNLSGVSNEMEELRLDG